MLEQATSITSTTTGTVRALVRIPYRSTVLPPRARSKRVWTDQIYEGEFDIPSAHDDDAPVVVTIEEDQQQERSVYTYRVHRGNWYAEDVSSRTLESYVEKWQTPDGVRELLGYCEGAHEDERRRPRIADGLATWAKTHLIIDGQIWFACDEPCWFHDIHYGFSWCSFVVRCVHHHGRSGTANGSAFNECYRLDELDLAKQQAEARQQANPIYHRNEAGDVVPAEISVTQIVTLLRPDLLSHPIWRHHAAQRRMSGVLASVRDLTAAIGSTEELLSKLLEVLPADEKAMDLGGDQMRLLQGTLRDLRSRISLHSGGDRPS